MINSVHPKNYPILLLIFLFLGGCLLSLKPDAAFADELLVYILSVGHGDAILLEWTGDGNKEWVCLVDGGESPKNLAAHLSKRRISHIDLLIGTHPDSDHIGGFSGLDRRQGEMLLGASPSRL